MNVWLETFVQNMGTGIESINSTLTGSGSAAVKGASSASTGLTGLIAEIHTLTTGIQASEAARNEAFLATMQENRERVLALSSGMFQSYKPYTTSSDLAAVEQMRAEWGQQQLGQEQKFKALSSDIKSQKGDMILVVDALKEAVAFDVQCEILSLPDLGIFD